MKTATRTNAHVATAKFSMVKQVSNAPSVKGTSAGSVSNGTVELKLYFVTSAGLLAATMLCLGVVPAIANIVENRTAVPASAWTTNYKKSPKLNFASPVMLNTCTWWDQI